MLKSVVVIHYHELWLKGRNRSFFLGKFLIALRGALAEFPGVRMRQPGDRVVIEFGRDVPLQSVIERLESVLGIAYYPEKPCSVELRDRATIWKASAKRHGRK